MSTHAFKKPSGRLAKAHSSPWSVLTASRDSPMEHTIFDLTKRRRDGQTTRVVLPNCARSHDCESPPTQKVDALAPTNGTACMPLPALGPVLVAGQRPRSGPYSGR